MTMPDNRRYHATIASKLRHNRLQVRLVNVIKTIHDALKMGLGQ